MNSSVSYYIQTNLFVLLLLKLIVFVQLYLCILNKLVAHCVCAATMNITDIFFFFLYSSTNAREFNYVCLTAAVLY